MSSPEVSCRYGAQLNLIRTRGCCFSWHSSAPALLWLGRCGRALSLPGRRRKTKHFVPHLLKVYVGWTEEILIFHLPLYQNAATVETIAQPKLLDYLSLKRY